MDNSVLKEKDMLQMALRPAVELSYLAEQEQQELLCVLGQESCTPSYGQAIKIRRFSEEGKLDANVLLSIMQEEKPNQIEQFRMPKDRIARYFPPAIAAYCRSLRQILPDLHDTCRIIIAKIQDELPGMKKALFPLTKTARSVQKLPKTGYILWNDFLNAGRRSKKELPPDEGKYDDCGAILYSGGNGFVFHRR